MTSVAVWYVKQTEELWSCADTRVSGGASVLTDLAAKILPLQLRWSKPSQPGWKLAGEATIGFAYAGGVLPALLTHAALNVFLQNLGCGYEDATGQDPPSMRKVAELCAYLSDKYLREMKADADYLVEYAIYGKCPASGKFEAYHISLDEREGPPFSWSYEVLAVDVSAGKMILLGENTDQLRIAIDDLRKKTPVGSPITGVEPRVAILRRIVNPWFEGIGGTMQFGIADNESFSVQGFAYDRNQEAGAVQYLGFTLAEEIEPKIERFIVMTARL